MEGIFSTEGDPRVLPLEALVAQVLVLGVLLSFCLGTPFGTGLDSSSEDSCSYEDYFEEYSLPKASKMIESPRLTNVTQSPRGERNFN